MTQCWRFPQVNNHSRQRWQRLYSNAHLKSRAKNMMKRGIQLPVMDSVVAASPPGVGGGGALGGRVTGAAAERRAHKFSRWNAVMQALCNNGYLRPKMVRVRLLHYFICKLVGACAHAASSLHVATAYSLSCMSTKAIREAFN